jgi:hypothetical protein
MGWDDSHLHDFRNHQNRYGDPTLLEEVIDESKTSLCQMAPRKGNRFIYTYDFGDNWEHDVLVEEIDRSSASAMSRCKVDGTLVLRKIAAVCLAISIFLNLSPIRTTQIMMKLGNGSTTTLIPSDSTRQR